MSRIVSLILLLLLALPSYSESLFEITLREAKQGNAMSQNNLAAYYRNMGNCEEAVYWYRKAVAQGDRVALFGLGQCYVVGCGVPKDYSTAALYIEQSAQKGLKEAQVAIALMYRNGLGVRQNVNKANYWQTKANNH
jgi:TPR repeat protein